MIVKPSAAPELPGIQVGHTVDHRVQHGLLCRVDARGLPERQPCRLGVRLDRTRSLPNPRPQPTAPETVAAGNGRQQMPRFQRLHSQVATTQAPSLFVSGPEWNDDAELETKVGEIGGQQTCVEYSSKNNRLENRADIPHFADERSAVRGSCQLSVVSGQVSGVRCQWAVVRGQGQGQVNPSPFILHPSPFILHPSSFILHPFHLSPSHSAKNASTSGVASCRAANSRNNSSSSGSASDRSPKSLSRASSRRSGSA